MINVVIEFLRDELNDYLVSNIPVGDPQRVVASNVVQQEEDTGSLSDLKDDSILFSLIHIEEDRVFKDQRKVAISGGGNVQYREPDIRVNLYCLFSSHFKNYLTGLQNLSAVIAFFQANNVFDASDYPALDPGIGRVVVDLHTFTLDQNFQFWQSLGGKFLPSVMYKLRILIYQEDATTNAALPISQPVTNLMNNS